MFLTNALQVVMSLPTESRILKIYIKANETHVNTNNLSMQQLNIKKVEFVSLFQNIVIQIRHACGSHAIIASFLELLIKKMSMPTPE